MCSLAPLPEPVCILQVSYFSWKQDGQGEEECLSDLSFEEDEFKPPELD